MKRKVLSSALAVLILLCFTQPAAALLLPNQRGTTITAIARLPVISVSVPASADVLINPLQFPVEIDSGSTRDQIICSDAVMSSYSDVPLSVGVQVTGAVKEGSDMTLATAPTNKTGTAKEAFVYFEIVQSNYEEVRRSLWAESYDPAKHVPVSNGTPQTKADMLRLEPLNKYGEVAKGGYAQFRLAGDAVRTPTNEWNESDGIDVMIAFTFKPISYVS